MNKLKDLITFFGFIFFIYGLISAIFYENHFWYSYFVIGGTLFLGGINYKNKHKTIFYLFKNNKLELLKIYLFYLIFTIILELIGRFIFKLWGYPYFNTLDWIINVIFIGYPFAFFFIYESFVLIHKEIKNFNLSIIATTLISAFLHEIPNTFVWEWIYKIPYISFSIFRINIIVIIGWIILILIPIHLNKTIENKNLN